MPQWRIDYSIVNIIIPSTVQDIFQPLANSIDANIVAVKGQAIGYCFQNIIN